MENTKVNLIMVVLIYGKYKGKITNEGSTHLMESFLERLKVVGRFMTHMENTKEKL